MTKSTSSTKTKKAKESNVLDAKIVTRLVDALDGISNSLKSVNDKLDTLGEKAILPPAENKPPSEAAPSKVAEPSAQPVPTEYSEIIATVFNQKFGIEVTSQPDRPAFELVIEVPEEYSNAGKNHWEHYGNDKRIKILDYAIGSHGVQDYAELVAKQLGTETMSRVKVDRALVV